jgi:uncharacterized membrane protein YheB (UPF0754 family)
LPQLYSLIATPFVTGFVGYFTNFLAIKMLFRPHSKKWYSFGWQGVIPKNRNKLAREIGIMVGNELISDKEIKNAIESDKFQIMLEKAVSKELESLLKKDYGSLYDISEKLGIDFANLLPTALDKLLDNDEFINKINEFIRKEVKNTVDNFLQKTISDFGDFEEKTGSIVENLIKKGNWQDFVVDAISSSLNNFILSGKSIKDILPDNFDAKFEKLSEIITDKAINSIDKLFDDAETRKLITKKLINMKDNLFEGGVIDSIKLGFISMFLTEEVISSLVDKELPKLIKAIKNQPEVKEKIKENINKQIINLVNKPIYTFASNIGMETLFELRSNAIISLKNYLKSDSFTSKISETASGVLNKYSNFTLRSILNNFGFKIDDKIYESIDIKNILKKNENHQLFTSLGVSVLKQIELKNIYEKIPEQSFEQMKGIIINEINMILDKHLPNTMQTLDLPNIVEDKINSLNLYQVENLLFSFMKDQFKWINILGFILGFLFGLIQSLIFYFFPL